MLDTDTKRRIDTVRDILVGKVPDPKSLGIGAIGQEPSFRGREAEPGIQYRYLHAYGFPPSRERRFGSQVLLRRPPATDFSPQFSTPPTTQDSAPSCGD
ncbi:MAG: hypothetical protein IPG33_03235 [Betaproteobacteria bacterium]|nr:hypothetical protein [Betaproteobacteria bacterium]